MGHNLLHLHLWKTLLRLYHLFQLGTFAVLGRLATFASSGNLVTLASPGNLVRYHLWEPWYVCLCGKLWYVCVSVGNLGNLHVWDTLVGLRLQWKPWCSCIFGKCSYVCILGTPWYVCIFGELWFILVRLHLRNLVRLVRLCLWETLASLIETLVRLHLEEI